MEYHSHENKEKGGGILVFSKNRIHSMKKIVFILFLVFIALGVLACNDTTKDIEDNATNDITIEKEVNSISDGNDISPDKEEVSEEVSIESNYDKISVFMEEKSRDAFSPYYELLDFQISNYEEEVVDENVEAVFIYTITCKNYDKDPDTVGYIKEAKESGNPNYQQMYDEYLQPREMNFHFKTVIGENDSITLYSNVSPVGIEWVETEMTDYILN